MNGEGFLSLYRSRLHQIQDWATYRRPPQNRGELFNYKYAWSRNITKRCFGLLKKYWAILRGPSFYPIRMQTWMILVCCLLHNFIHINMAVDLEEYDPLADDEMPVGEEPLVSWKERWPCSRNVEWIYAYEW